MLPPGVWSRNSSGWFLHIAPLNVITSCQHFNSVSVWTLQVKKLLQMWTDVYRWWWAEAHSSLPLLRWCWPPPPPCRAVPPAARPPPPSESQRPPSYWCGNVSRFPNTRSEQKSGVTERAGEIKKIILFHFSFFVFGYSKTITLKYYTVEGSILT